MGIFIQVEIHEALCAPDSGAGLVEVCPVNVFTLVSDRIVIDPESEDECTLCDLCIRVCKKNAITIRKRYEN